MSSDWARVLERCELLASGRVAVRLANLAIAAQVAARAGLLPYLRLDGQALAASVHELAVELLPVDTSDLLSWRALADEAAMVAPSLSGDAGMDTWVQAFQACDPARKSRGAYATPQPLARPMARQLLATETAPARIIDPSAGAGGLLVAVLRELLRQPRDRSAARGHALRLFGVELDPVARELACLHLWITAGDSKLTPSRLAKQVVVDNAITRDWWARERFDALIMNPPWDSLRHGPVESAGEDLSRDLTVQRLLQEAPGDPALPPLYSAQGRGDRNLYKAFVELAPHLLTQGAPVVALLPGAWSSDLGTALLRHRYLEQLDIDRWTSFENQRGYFPIDGRYKFGVLAARRHDGGTRELSIRGFAADAGDVRRRHVRLRLDELAALGGTAGIIPDLVSAAERRIMLRFRRGGVPFFAGDGPFGPVLYDREVDLTEDRKRGQFERLEHIGARPLGDGWWVTDGGEKLVPLVEGRMVSQYDFHAKSWIAGAGRTAQWSWANGHRLSECQPQFLVAPATDRRHRIAICDVTSATNTRTVHATWVPSAWRCGNTAPVLVFESERQAFAALAVLNSLVFDWLARRTVAGLHLNRFYLEALSWPRLRPSDVDHLAASAARLTAMSPRFSSLRDPGVTQAQCDEGYVAIHAAIEGTVAGGYGLSAEDLGTVFSADTSDRRGFWRHFASDPHATPIAHAALRAYERQTLVGKRG